MLVYSRETFIEAHENVGIPYKNHSYDRYVREAICSGCGAIVGGQVRYPHYDGEFCFEDRDKQAWKYCPFCAEKLY